MELSHKTGNALAYGHVGRKCIAISDTTATKTDTNGTATWQSKYQSKYHCYYN